MRAIAALSAFLAIPALAHDPGYRFADVVVESVYDGDSLRVSLPGVHPLWGDRAMVRVAGIDAPEIRGECEAEKAAARVARDRLRQLVLDGTPPWAPDASPQPPPVPVLRVDLKDCGREKFGRLLCRVLADGQDVGAVLVAEGHAREYDGGKRAGWCE